MEKNSIDQFYIGYWGIILRQDSGDVLFVCASSLFGYEENEIINIGKLNEPIEEACFADFKIYIRTISRKIFYCNPKEQEGKLNEIKQLSDKTIRKFHSVGSGQLYMEANNGRIYDLSNPTINKKEFRPGKEENFKQYRILPYSLDNQLIKIYPFYNNYAFILKANKAYLLMRSLKEEYLLDILKTTPTEKSGCLTKECYKKYSNIIYHGFINCRKPIEIDIPNNMKVVNMFRSFLDEHGAVLFVIYDEFKKNYRLSMVGNQRYEFFVKNKENKKPILLDLEIPNTINHVLFKEQIIFILSSTKELFIFGDEDRVNYYKIAIEKIHRASCLEKKLKHYCFIDKPKRISLKDKFKNIPSRVPPLSKIKNILFERMIRIKDYFIFIVKPSKNSKNTLYIIPDYDYESNLYEEKEKKWGVVYIKEIAIVGNNTNVVIAKTLNDKNRGNIVQIGVEPSYSNFLKSKKIPTSPFFDNSPVPFKNVISNEFIEQLIWKEDLNDDDDFVFVSVPESDDIKEKSEPGCIIS